MAETGYELAADAARRYEQPNVPTAMRPLAEMMVEHVPLKDGDRVLDVACGTGIVTRVLLEQVDNVGSIVGVDINPNMLDVAREHTPTTDIPIEWQQGDACALPFPDGSFDVAWCSQGLQFIPDKLTALREMHRVLAPGGRLAFTVWGQLSPYNMALVEAFTRHISEAAATTAMAPFALRDADTIRRLLDDAGFDGLEMQTLVLMRRAPSSALAFAASLPFGPAVAAASEAARAALEQDVKAAMQSYDEVDGFFVMPSDIHLVQARVA